MPTAKVHRAWAFFVDVDMIGVLCGTSAYTVLATTADSEVTCSRCQHSMGLESNAGAMFESSKPWLEGGIKRLVNEGSHAITGEPVWKVHEDVTVVPALTTDEVRSKLLDLRNRLESDAVHLP